MISLAEISFGQSKIDSLENAYNSLKSQTEILIDIEHQLYVNTDQWDFETYNRFVLKGLQIANELRADTSLAYLYNQRGFYYYQIGDFIEAKKDFLLAIEYYDHVDFEQKTNRVKHFEADSYQTLGIINDIQGLTDFSLKNYLTAIEIFREINDSLNIADCLMNIGIIYSVKDKYVEAEEHYQKAMEYFIALDDSLGIAILILNQGVLAEDENNLVTAQYYYKNTMELSAKIKDQYGLALASNNYASVLIKLGQTDSAKKYIDISFEICKDIIDSSLIAEIVYNYGDYYFAIKNNLEAEKALKNSYRISSAQQIVELQLKSASLLSDFYSENKKYKLAFKYLSIYDSIKTKINADDLKKRFSLIDDQYEEDTRKKEAAIKEFELKTISDKLKYNQALSILAFTGLFAILIFIVILFRRYKQVREIKNKLIKINLELSKINREYQQTLISKKEKDILLKEIHHRVKNNLQIINSLLYSQSLKAPKNTQDIFLDLQTRISAIALLHDQLYTTKDFSKIEVKSYFMQLVNNLKSAYANVNNVKYEIKVNVDFLELDMLHPLGLIVNEIISNSIKYAFGTSSKNNRIYLYFDRKGDDYILKIGDSGIGFDKNEALQKQNTVGLELINNLSEQLSGKIELISGKGTNYKLIFSID
jgi:two-component sensor histidine kinase